jgi:hypothetical protein
MLGTGTNQFGSPPDLLKRFVHTPFQGFLRIERAEILVQSNDPTMIDVPATPSNRTVLGANSWLWKLIYDSDAESELREATSILFGTRVVANMGSGCLVGLDRERSEVFAFLGITGENPTFREVVVPFLTKLMLTTGD